MAFTVTRTQFQTSSYNINPTLTITAPASGSSLVVMFTIANTLSVTSLTDNQGNTYTQDFTTTDYSGNEANIFYYRAANITNAPTVITINTDAVSAFQTGHATTAEIAGGTLAVDTTLALSSSAGYADAHSESITTLTDNDLVLFYIGLSGDRTIAGYSPWILEQGGTATRHFLLYQADAGAAGVETCAFNLSGSASFARYTAVAYKAATSSTFKAGRAAGSNSVIQS